MSNNFEKSDQIKYREVKKLSIEKVESLPIRDFDKVDLILLLAGFKTAVDINVPINNDNWHNIIKDLGLYFIEDEGLRDESKRKYYIARSQEDAEKLHDAFAKNNDTEAGILSGYPATAVENYVKTTEDLKSPNLTESDVINLLKERYAEIVDLPLEVKDIQELLPLAHFGLSRQNWKEEIVTIKKWADTVRNLDPELYDRIHGYYKKFPSEEGQNQD